MYEELKALSYTLDTPASYFLRQAVAPMLAYYSKVFKEYESLWSLEDTYSNVAMRLFTDHFARKESSTHQLTLTLAEDQYQNLQFLAEKMQLTLDEATRFILNEYFAIIFEQ